MGQQCSGSEREAYMRAQEEERARALGERPRVVTTHTAKPEDAQDAKSIAHPQVQHQGGARANQLLAEDYRHKRDPYEVEGEGETTATGIARHTPAQSTAPLTNASGAFVNPMLVDVYYDTKVSHIILAASAQASVKYPHSHESQLASQPPPASAAFPSAADAFATAPTWHALTAIPYPTTSGDQLAALPFGHQRPTQPQGRGRRVGSEERSHAHAHTGSAMHFDEADLAAFHALGRIRKPKFGAAVSSLSREGPQSPADKAARKAERAARRMAREEQERAQLAAMKEMRQRVLEGPRQAYPDQVAEEKHDASHQPQHHRRQSSQAAPLNFNYVREEEPESERSREPHMTPRTFDAPPQLTNRSNLTPAATHRSGQSVDYGGGALDHFFSSVAAPESHRASPQPRAITPTLEYQQPRARSSSLSLSGGGGGRSARSRSPSVNHNHVAVHDAFEDPDFDEENEDYFE